MQLLLQGFCHWTIWVSLATVPTSHLLHFACTHFWEWTRLLWRMNRTQDRQHRSHLACLLDQCGSSFLSPLATLETLERRMISCQMDCQLQMSIFPSSEMHELPFTSLVVKMYANSFGSFLVSSTASLRPSTLYFYFYLMEHHQRTILHFSMLELMKGKYFFFLSEVTCQASEIYALSRSSHYLIWSIHYWTDRNSG